VILLAQNERLARRVGAVALLALATAAAVFVFLLDRIELRPSIRIRVVFRHSTGLHEHAALVVAGQPVGRIEAISPVPHGAGGLLAGEVGVAVTVAIDDRNAWQVPARAEIFVASRGPLSDRYLQVAPPAGDPGPAIRDGQELRGVDPPSLDNVLQRTWANITTYQRFADAVRPELAALRGQLAVLRGQLDGVAGDLGAVGGVRGLVREVRGLVGAAQATYAGSLGGDPGVAQIRGMIHDARAAIDEIGAAVAVLGPRVDAIAANLGRVRGHLAATGPIARAQQVIAAVRATLDKLAPVLATIDELGERFANGEGSIARLLNDPEFPEDTKELSKIMKRQPWKVIVRPPD